MLDFAIMGLREWDSSQPDAPGEGTVDAADRWDDDADFRARERHRQRRPWYLIIASLMLVALVVVVWAKWSESRNEAQLLRAEVKQVYVEAETLRTQANQAQQRVALLEQQVRALLAERTEILKKLEDAGIEPPPRKAAVKRPVRKRPAPADR